LQPRLLKKSLNLECCLDDEELKNMNMIVEKFHGECNYTMKPNENRKIARLVLLQCSKIN